MFIDGRVSLAALDELKQGSGLKFASVTCRNGTEVAGHGKGREKKLWDRRVWLVLLSRNDSAG